MPPTIAKFPTTPSTGTKVLINCQISSLSISDMSFEKRLMMRPVGVSWKKDMGARSTDLNMALCKRFAATKP